MQCIGPGINTSSCSDTAENGKAFGDKHFVGCCGALGDKGKCVNTAQFNKFCSPVNDSLAF